MRRYLMFARQFKPKICKEAAEYMVEEYRHLRARDGGGASKSAWRITVRQLESMIRLSEAMAKMHCKDEVKAKHVKEAFRLLNKSIIRVEQPDVHLEEEENEAQPMEEDNNEEQPTQPTQENQAEPETEQATQQPKKSMKLTFEEYKQLANLLVLHMRKIEEEEDTESEGMRRSDLVNWYLKEIESEIDTEAELIEKKTVVEKVIYRLIHYDHIIIELAKSGLKGLKAKENGDITDETDPVLVVHPNYTID